MQLIAATPIVRHFSKTTCFRAHIPIRTFIPSIISTMPPKDKYTDPELRDEVKEEIHNGDKGGAPGQWSARKAQMMASEYKKRGGGVSSHPFPPSPSPPLTFLPFSVHNRQKRSRRLPTTPLQVGRRRLANQRGLCKRQGLVRNPTSLPPQSSLGKYDRAREKGNR